MPISKILKNFFTRCIKDKTIKEITHNGSVSILENMSTFIVGITALIGKTVRYHLELQFKLPKNMLKIWS